MLSNIWTKNKVRMSYTPDDRAKEMNIKANMVQQKSIDFKKAMKD